jgi:hypothetical protein
MEENLSIVSYDVTEEALRNIESIYSDPKVPESREEYAELAGSLKVVRKLRTTVEKRRKELKKEALEYGRKVDSIAKELTKRILAVESPMKEIKDRIDKEEAEREAKRIAAIRKKIDAIKSLPMRVFQLSLDDAVRLFEASKKAEVTTEEFCEFAPEAKKALEASMSEAATIINRMRVDAEVRKKAEEDRIKLEAERKAQEQARIEAEKKAAEVRRKLEAERKAIEAEKARLSKDREVPEEVPDPKPTVTVKVESEMKPSPAPTVKSASEEPSLATLTRDLVQFCLRAHPSEEGKALEALGFAIRAMETSSELAEIASILSDWKGFGE